MDKVSLGLEMGAIGYLKKPVDTQNLDEIFAQLKEKNTIEPKRILLFDSSSDYRKSLEKSLKEKINPVEIVSVESMDDYQRIIDSSKQDCIIVNQSFKDAAGASVAELIQKEKKAATIIFFTGTEAHEVVVEKTELAINELKKKTADEFVLHQPVPVSDPAEKPIQAPVPPVPVNIEPAALEGILKDRKVLMADDDMRNIYALSTVLESEGMNVITASDGKEALQKLNENPDVEIVLMDIMMPEMDGYEAMEKIRKDHRFTNLPMFALTAKAMVGDREKCLAAGASDYVSKPINMDELLGKMKVWLYK
jgi:CheY-like chemotaxis protein